MDLTLALTHNCNLACSYCYAGKKRPVSMTEAVARRALEYAFSFTSKKMQLGFFGGEPLLEWELLQYATTLAEQLAAAQTPLAKTVTTNATLLSVERAEWLKQHGFYVGISLDGNAAMHDAARPFAGGASSFQQSVHGLQNALRLWPDVEVILVPDPRNVEHLAAGVAYLVDELHVQRISLNTNFYAAWDDDALELLREEFEAISDRCIAWYREGGAPRINIIDNKIHTRLKNGFTCKDKCNFGEREIAVAPSGRIYPCERLIGEDLGGELCLGNVFDGIDARRQQAILAQRGNLNTECGTCAIRRRCMNWCCCINYTLTGAINVTDGIVCFHERTSVAAADRAAETLYREGCPAFLARFYEAAWT